MCEVKSRLRVEIELQVAAAAWLNSEPQRYADIISYINIMGIKGGQEKEIKSVRLSFKNKAAAFKRRRPN
jgi:hypothetical protein